MHSSPKNLSLIEERHEVVVMAHDVIKGKHIEVGAFSVNKWATMDDIYAFSLEYVKDYGIEEPRKEDHKFEVRFKGRKPVKVILTFFPLLETVKEIT